MSVRITYFVHGTTTDNEQKLSTGWNPGELCELGIKQAKELPGLIGDKQFDAVFCSDLKRAVDSANLAFGDKYEIIVDKRLRECNYGDNNGKPSKFKEDMKQFISQPFPDGESYTDVETRMADFVEFLKQNYQDKHIAIVAHEGPQLALDVILGGKTWEQAIDENWREVGSWQPGWEYVIE